MPSFTDYPANNAGNCEMAVSDMATDSLSTSRDDWGLPLDTDYWICTCGHENEGTECCEACDEFLHGRDLYWES